MTKPTTEDVVLLKNRDLKNDYYAVTLGPYSRAAACRPGQFVHVQIPSSDIMFRRAFSIASVDPITRSVEIIFRVFGRGTRQMARLHKGDRLNLLGPLGNSFARPRKSQHAIMVAGGIGFPPLLFFAEDLVKRGHDPQKIHFCYGGRSKPDILEKRRIRRLGVDLCIATDDGSAGEQGLVTAPVERLLEEIGTKKTRLYGCGPEAMLKATNELGLRMGATGQLSLEAPMPCGVGICLGCVVPLTAGGYARVCADGPVFEIGEVAL